MHIRAAQHDDRESLFYIWLRSVRATHSFLNEADIERLIPLARAWFTRESLQMWVLVDDTGALIGFMGMSGSSIDALFVAPESVGKGGGRMLIDHAQSLHPGEALTLDVNEQNPETRKFYEKCGFEVTGRSPVDSTGAPFPLLHMSRAAR